MCQQLMDYSRLDFELDDAERFTKLQTVFAALKTAKERDLAGEHFPDPEDEYWRTLFDERSLQHFWWPTPDELADWTRRWQAAPVATRHTDPSLQTPWGFSSMIDSFWSGEYDLISIDRTSDTAGRLQFNPHACPYGGTGCMRALIESFGGVVTGEAGT